MNTIATAPVATQSKAAGYAKASAFAAATAVFSVGRVATQGVLLVARTANFFVREAVQAHVPTAIDCVKADAASVKVAFTAAAEGAPIFDAVVEHGLASVARLSDEQIERALRTVDFKW